MNKRVGTVPHPAVPLRTELNHPVDRRPLLRGAGITGISGSLLMLAAFVVVGALGLPDTSTAESLQRFPEIQQARVVENLLYLAAVVLGSAPGPTAVRGDPWLTRFRRRADDHGAMQCTDMPP
jgi:hypothetical protein